MSFWEREVMGIAMKTFLANLVISIALIAAGLIIGNLVNYFLKKAINRAKLERTLYSFLDIFVTIIKWAVYVIFINLGIKQLGIPQFTDWLTNILIVIPALVGALLLIIVGFAIASYLKESIELSRIQGHKILSKIFFYFILYIFLAFALKTALISIDAKTVNWLLVVLTAIVAFVISYLEIRKD